MNSDSFHDNLGSKAVFHVCRIICNVDSLLRESTLDDINSLGCIFIESALGTLSDLVALGGRISFF